MDPKHLENICRFFKLLVEKYYQEHFEHDYDSLWIDLGGEG